MEKTLIEDKEFKNIHFAKDALVNGKYDNCTFVACIFSEADLFEVAFIDCEFVDCDFTNQPLAQTVFRDVRFVNCKLLGLHFEHCNTLLISMTFEGCQMKLSSFYQLNLKQTHFSHCNLQELDLTEADLTEAVLDDCDLAGAIFDRTVLEKADLSTSYNYIINPEMNRVKKAKFSTDGLAGLLTQYDIVVK